MADTKGDRQLLGKWEHSLVVLDGDVPVATAYGYERRGEGSEQYPANTLYVAELVVAETHQRRGIARHLLKEFIEFNNDLGFLYLDGTFNYSVQTNAAKWNNHVRALYESFGFKVRAMKDYANRTDVVMGMTPEL